MPLFVDNQQVTEQVVDVKDFFDKHDKLKSRSLSICSQPVREVGPKALLYVGQREIGGTTPDDPVISVIGSDDATTCHIAVLRHSGSGATCVAHFDGCSSRQGLDTMLEIIKNLSVDKPDGQIDIHLIGGFNDDRNMSHELSVEILNLLQTMKDTIHLQTACITHLNTEQRNGIPFPIFYGLAVDIKSGEIFKATFTDKGPDQSLRGARHFTGGREMINIYDPKTKQLTLEPFSYDQIYNIDQWLRVPDHVIRKRLSTSPVQEPPHFEASVRASIKQMKEHPDPLTSMFPGSKPRMYKKSSAGQWEKL